MYVKTLYEDIYNGKSSVKELKDISDIAGFISFLTKKLEANSIGKN